VKFKQVLVTTLLFATSFAGGAEMIDEVVQDFELDSYLGTWYEIARLDHSFERGLEAVTATYSLKDNGSVRVLNRGYKTKSTKWKTATGSAKYASEANMGAFKVTFFWPFYGGYNIVLLADDYSYALVAGDSENYLWLLSRKPKISADTQELMLERARSLGYDVSKLIYVDQSKNL